MKLRQAVAIGKIITTCVIRADVVQQLDSMLPNINETDPKDIIIRALVTRLKLEFYEGE